MKMNTTVNDDSSWKIEKYGKFYRVIEDAEKLARLGSLILMLHWRSMAGRHRVLIHVMRSVSVRFPCTLALFASMSKPMLCIHCIV